LTPATRATGDLDFEGRSIPLREGDTVASALFRSGVRTFSRSFKYHRRRGLYCLTGDCPNCLVSVDGVPCQRACVTDAVPGQRVTRETGWPSTDRDLLAILDKLHRLLPVGFYYKTLIRPRWTFPLVEPLIRRVAGLGTIPLGLAPEDREARHVHPDLLVVGGGVAGLAAALAAAESGQSVLLCDEGRLGEKIAPGPSADRVAALAAEARSMPAISILERSPVVGIYDGPLAVVNEPSFLHLVHPRRIVVAAGAVEQHGVFPGNDLPGVWLARGAARLAGVHDLAPGTRVVLVANTTEAEGHAATLRAVGAEVVVLRGEVVEATGRKRVRGAVVASPAGQQHHSCDALVLALGVTPRDGLVRQAAGLPLVAAGDVSQPGCSLLEAEESGRRAGSGESNETSARSLPDEPRAGIVCLCEDVGVDELDHAWHEGFRSTEILKRYTTATMGPCQGAMCHGHVQAFVRRHDGATGPADGPTTARPPARGITVEQVAAGVRHEIHRRTALHDRHLALGATMEHAGVWQRPERYGEVLDEYRAVREAVSVMDVGTLGKYVVGGRDALEFVDRLYPCNIRDLEPGSLRYALVLSDRGYVVDDGLVCAVGDGRWYLTFTSAGGASAEATLRDWAETWGLSVHVVNVTDSWGALNVAGPRARELLQRLTDDALDADRFPYLGYREITVAGVPCRAMRLGFVGELSYELHHDSLHSVRLWDALLDSGRDFGVMPHGLEALRLLRLEKAHVIVGQDTDFDATPAKLNMEWAVRMDKPYFVGKQNLARMSEYRVDKRLIGVTFDAPAPPEGAVIHTEGGLGVLTSSRSSPVLGKAIGLGWIKLTDGIVPRTVEVGDALGTVVAGAFYDPEGRLVRA
jgi:sarcosine oxidase, subunit alpha